MTEPSQDPEKTRLDPRVLGGTIWMILVKLCSRGIGIISTLILARLLVPEDFGLIAMTMSVVALVELMSAFSFDIVLIQNQDAQRKHFDTVWTLNILFGAAIALILVGLAYPAAEFYKEERLAQLIFVVAGSVFIGGFVNIGTVLFRKNLDFRKEFKYMVLKKIIGFAVTVPLAIVWRNYWALIAGIVASSAGGVVLSYVMQSYRPRLSLSAMREIFSFSVWLFVNNLLFFVRGRAADFVVGRMSGAQTLGILTISMEISLLVTAEMVQPINRAVFPGYSKLNKSVSAVRQAYLDVYSAISLFAIPAGIGLAVVAPQLVPIALGKGWLDAVVPVQILSLYGSLVAIQGSNGIVFLAMGKPRILTKLAAVSAIITIPMLIAGTQRFGLLGACWALLAAVLVMMPVNFVAIKKMLNITLSTWASALVRPLLASTAMTVACLSAKLAIVPNSIIGAVVMLITTVVAGALTYTGTLYLLWRLADSPEGPEKHTLAYFREKLGTIKF